jgi:heme exporter protein D
MMRCEVRRCTHVYALVVIVVIKLTIGIIKTVLFRKQKKIQEEENLEASRQRTAEYHRKLDAERELEMKLRREERQQLRQSWANEPEPEKKPKKDNDFDLSM